MRKFLCLLLALVMIFGLVACGSGDGDTTTPTTAPDSSGTGDTTEDPPPAPPPTGDDALVNYAKTGSLPIADDLVTLSFTTHSGHSVLNPPASNDLLLYQYYEELTNIHIEWDVIPNDSYQEVMAVRVSALSDLPDILNAHDLVTGLQKLFNDGVIIQQDELLATYGYHINKWAADNPGLRRSMNETDGKFYGVSNTVIDSHLGPNVMINTYELERCGIEMPTTPDEFLDMLRAFRDISKLPAPLSFWYTYGSGEDNSYFNVLGNFFDMHLAYNQEATVYNGEVVVIFDHPGYKELISFANTMYKENLMNKDFASATLDTMIEYVSTGQTGATMFWGTFSRLYGAMSPDAQQYPEEDREEYPIYVPMPPLKTATGQQYRDRRLDLQGDTMTITTNCPDDKLGYAMAWIDWLFASEEAMDTMNNGIPGLTYDKGADGSIIKHDPPAGSTWNEWVSSLGGSQPPRAYRQTIEDWKVFMPAWQIDMSFAMQQYYVDPPLLNIPFTPEENESLAFAYASYDPYAAAWIDNFITGAASMDQWDEFIAGLDAVGKQDIVDAFSARYERQKALG